MTDTPVSSVLDAIEQDENDELDAAKARYAGYVIQLAAATSRKSVDLKQLRGDLKALGRSVKNLQADANALRERRQLVGDGGAGDLAAQARKRYAEVKEARMKANELAKLKQQAADAAKEAARQAGWHADAALDGISRAGDAQRRRGQRVKDLTSRLRQIGVPDAALPPLPGEAPPPRIPHRVLAKAFVGNSIREPGDVVMLPERVKNAVVRPLAEGEAEESVPPRWKVECVRNFRDTTGKLRILGDVYLTGDDPTPNPFLRVVPDDTPLGLGDGEPQDQDEESTEDQEQQAKQEPEGAA